MSDRQLQRAAANLASGGAVGKRAGSAPQASANTHPSSRRRAGPARKQSRRARRRFCKDWAPACAGVTGVGLCTLWAKLLPPRSGQDAAPFDKLRVSGFQGTSPSPTHHTHGERVPEHIRQAPHTILTVSGFRSTSPGPTHPAQAELVEAGFVNPTSPPCARIPLRGQPAAAPVRTWPWHGPNWPCRRSPAS